MAYKVFQNGLPLGASELNDYLMNQAIATFADAAARDAAITSPAEGQVVYLQSPAGYFAYNGFNWLSFVLLSIS
jgi:hypothetical protein